MLRTGAHSAAVLSNGGYVAVGPGGGYLIGRGPLESQNFTLPGMAAEDGTGPHALWPFAAENNDDAAIVYQRGSLVGYARMRDGSVISQKTLPYRVHGIWPVACRFVGAEVEIAVVHAMSGSVFLTRLREEQVLHTEVLANPPQDGIFGWLANHLVLNVDMVHGRHPLSQQYPDVIWTGVDAGGNIVGKQRSDPPKTVIRAGGQLYQIEGFGEFPKVAWPFVLTVQPGNVVSILMSPFDPFTKIVVPQPPVIPTPPEVKVDVSHVKQVMENTYKALGSPDLGNASTREQRSAFWMSVCAVLHYGHPTLNPKPGDSRFGSKRRDRFAPPTDDTLAYRLSSDQHFRVWDCITGVGAAGWKFSEVSGEGDEITGQEWLNPPQSSLPAASGGVPPANPPRPGVLQEKCMPAIYRVDLKYQHLRQGSKDECREWLNRVAYVLNRTVMPTIGMKKADANRPVSYNTIGIGITGSLEAVAICSEGETGPRQVQWQSFGTVNQVWVAPTQYTDMEDIITGLKPSEPVEPEPPTPTPPTVPPSQPVRALAIVAQIEALAGELARLLKG